MREDRIYTYIHAFIFYSYTSLHSCVSCQNAEEPNVFMFVLLIVYIMQSIPTCIKTCVFILSKNDVHMCQLYIRTVSFVFV
jgi:hypothetical protein